MTTTETLLKVTKHAHHFTNKLIHGIPDNKWTDTPPIIESNILWQVGHLISAQHYHAIMCVHGPQKELMETIPFREYAQSFASKLPASELAGKFKPETLQQHLKMVQDWTENLLVKLNDDDLNSDLVPTKFTNPIAKTKFEAISWNCQHIMWHCGQIAMLKRVLGLGEVVNL